MFWEGGSRERGPRGRGGEGEMQNKNIIKKKKNGRELLTPVRNCGGYGADCVLIPIRWLRMKSKPSRMRYKSAFARDLRQPLRIKS